MLPTQLDNNLVQPASVSADSSSHPRSNTLCNFSAANFSSAKSSTKACKRRRRRKKERKSVWQRNFFPFASSRSETARLRIIYECEAFPSLCFFLVFGATRIGELRAPTQLWPFLSPTNSDFIWRREWLKLSQQAWRNKFEINLLLQTRSACARQGAGNRLPQVVRTSKLKWAHLWWIIVWECMERFAVDSQRSLQLSLIRIETAKLQQRTDTRVLVRRPISKAGSVELRSIA